MNGFAKFSIKPSKKGGGIMRFKSLVKKTFAIVTMLLLMTSAAVNAESVQDKRASIREMRSETLEKLYKIHPSARGAIQVAYGYAVFNNADVTLGLVGGGEGNGLAVISGTGRETFMKTVEGSFGIGLGVKNYMLVFVFYTQKSFEDFTRAGWEWGGQATATAKDKAIGDSEEGAVSLGQNMWVYQLTDEGLELSLTFRGIRFYQDADLNKKN